MGLGIHPFVCVCVLLYVRVFICMCVSMCESCFYKYKVLMIAVKQLKEGREDEREKHGESEEKGIEPFCCSKAKKKHRLRICLASLISSLQSNYTAHCSSSPFINEMHAKS